MKSTAAEVLCRELGLGDLLERMPAGLLQMVGETGWQLSHGERSRLYIARALLQGADMIILDESFGALDPETLRRALRYVELAAKLLGYLVEKVEVAGVEEAPLNYKLHVHFVDPVEAVRRKLLDDPEPEADTTISEEPAEGNRLP